MFVFGSVRGRGDAAELDRVVAMVAERVSDKVVERTAVAAVVVEGVVDEGLQRRCLSGATAEV